MHTPKSNNHFREIRLIYFAGNDAGKNADGRVGSANKLTADHQYKLNHIGNGFLPQSLFFGNDPLAHEIIDRLYDNKVLKDDTFTKDKSDPYFLFLTALKDRRFPDNGKDSLKVLNALHSGGPETRAQALQIVKEAAGRDSTATKRIFEGWLDQLKQAQIDDQLKESHTASDDTIRNVQMQTDISDIAGLIKEVATTHPDSLRHGIAELESLDHATVEKINNLSERYKELCPQYVHAYFQCEELAKKLEDDKLAKPERERIEAEIAKLEAKGDALSAEIKAIQQEFIEPHDKAILWSRRMVDHLRQIQHFAQRAGFDISQTKTVRAWMLDNNDELSINIDPLTGAANKLWGDIQIERVYFEYNQDANGQIPEDHLGVMMVQYKNQRGQSITIEARHFIHQMDALEGHQEIRGMAALNNAIAKQTHYRDLAVGQEFHGQVLVDVVDGKDVYDKCSFKVTAIEEVNGMPRITISPRQLTTSRKKLLTSVDEKLYFDRRQSKFTAGQFAKFLKSNNYKRRPDNRDDLQQYANAVHANSKRQLTLPTKPGEQQPVHITDPNTSSIRSGHVTRQPDGSYTLTKNYETTLTPEQAAGDPDSPKSPRPVSYVQQTVPLNPYSFSGRELKETPEASADDPTKAAEAALENIVDAPPKKQQLDEAGVWIQEPQGPEIPLEALPYEVVHKVGGMDRPQTSWLADKWSETRIFSINDFWEMGKSMYEFFERRWTRRRKGRYSHIGKNLPYFGQEMQRINQQAENEVVNQYKEGINQLGVRQIVDLMRTTDDQDQMKACLIDLSEKGQLNWDDIEMWSNLNKFLSNDKVIPIPGNGDPRTQVSDSDPRTGREFLEAAIDSIWGESTYAGWYQSNKSSYAGNAKKYEAEGKELEGIDGGHGKRLAALLKAHKEGHWVDPHRYEGLILHAIDAGKSSIQAKIYYMVQGVAAQNSHGETILSIDRLAHINSELLGKFPPLEYMTARAPRGKGKPAMRFGIDDYRQWARWFDKNDPDNCEPNDAVDEFMWKFVVPSDQMEDRTNKAARNGENLDHDDMYAIVPIMNEQISQNICGNSAGNKKYLTQEGYANAFPGFSHFFRTMAEINKKNKMLEGIKSFVRYSGILRNHYKKGDLGFERLPDRVWDSPSIVSSTNTRVFLNELNSLVQNISKAYAADGVPGSEQLIDLCDKIFYQEAGNLDDPKEKKKQGEINHAYEQFGNIFSRVVKSDEGEKMRQIILRANLAGMPDYLSDEEKERRKNERAQAGNQQAA